MTDEISTPVFVDAMDCVAMLDQLSGMDVRRDIHVIVTFLNGCRS